MKSFHPYALFCFLLVSTLAAAPVHAGPYSDDLSKCLVESTTLDDKAALINWMFAALSRHPAVQFGHGLTDEQIDVFDRRMAAMFNKLLTETCLPQTEKGIRYEGATVLQTSFKVFGEVAARELFANDRVKATMEGFAKYLDKDKLQTLNRAK